ncbi:MAG TPA: hypothetical protein VF784_12555 [Anaerolineales bacterium]
MTWRTDIESEFEKANRARLAGNEGQARVCARRAAGIAAREYFLRRGSPVRTPSAYEVLQAVAADADVPARVRVASAWLTRRVDEEFKLPPDVDLVAEARAFCEGLLPGWLESP